MISGFRTVVNLRGQESFARHLRLPTCQADAAVVEISQETLNSFVSEAIIYYSNSRFSEEVLGSVVAAHNSTPMRAPERNRIRALERLIAVIGIDFLENKNLLIAQP